MSASDLESARRAAESMYTNVHVHPINFRGGERLPRPHSINLITDDFLGGYMQDGRMSVVRRFFCLFVAFDLFFVSLLWIICIMVTGDSISQALHKEVFQYTIYTSLFDVVVVTFCRFFILMLFYVILHSNNRTAIAFSTSLSCSFLVFKVFIYHWVQSNQQVFEVVLIIVPFVLAWVEAWFLDYRVITQEIYASRYFSDLTSPTERSQLIIPFLSSQEGNPPESVANYYSPLESAQNSDDDDDGDKNEEFHQKGLDYIRKAYDLLQSPDWKVEKVTKQEDTITTIRQEKLGKVFRLTARVKYPAKDLMNDLFYNYNDAHKWNPKLLESRVLHKINSYTDITYQVVTGAGGGFVQKRDFISLRCWRLCCDGNILIDGDEKNDGLEDTVALSSYEGSMSTIAGSVSSSKNPSVDSEAKNLTAETTFPKAFNTLSKSLGARDFNALVDYTEPPPLDDEFQDAVDNISEEARNLSISNMPPSERIYIIATVSVDYPITNTSKINYVRGENLLSCWAMREIEDEPEWCIFEWLHCVDIKGNIPRYILDSIFTTFMAELMTHLREHVKEMRVKKRKIPANK